MKTGTLIMLLATMFVTACAEQKGEPQPAQDEGLQEQSAKTVLWSADFEASLARAKAEKKLKKEVFSQEVFTRFAGDNLVLVMLDFPRSIPQSDAIKAQNKKLMTQYRVQGFPTVLIMNPEGKLVETTGYRPGGAQAYVDFLTGILEREAAR